MTDTVCQAPIVSDRCHAEAHPDNGDYFEVRIEACTAPKPPELTNDNLACTSADRSGT